MFSGRNCVVIAGVLTLGVAGLVHAQAPAPKPAVRAAAAPRAASTPATLNQVMRGILFTNSNVVFAAQDPDFIKQAAEKDPSTSPNPLTGIYNGWAAVENASLALTESASLLTMPGRRCSNGKPVPTARADWQKYVQGLRDAGMASYKAAQSKDSDKIVDAADVLATACAHCHEVYREKTPKQGGDASRCLP